LRCIHLQPRRQQRPIIIARKIQRDNSIFAVKQVTTAAWRTIASATKAGNGSALREQAGATQAIETARRTQSLQRAQRTVRAACEWRNTKLSRTFDWPGQRHQPAAGVGDCRVLVIRPGQTPRPQSKRVQQLLCIAGGNATSMQLAVDGGQQHRRPLPRVSDPQPAW
jgi:hypothetical protein